MTDSQRAIVTLLEQADPADLGRRAHGPFLTHPRFATVERRRYLVWRPLVQRWYAQRCLAVDPVVTLAIVRRTA